MIALSLVAGWEGDHNTALSYLEEGRSLIDGLDGRARAAYFYSMAVSSKQTGDLEGAMRAGIRSLALYEASTAQLEIATLNNHLALTYLNLGNLSRSNAHAAEARRVAEQLSDAGALGVVTETESQIAYAEQRFDDALRLAMEAAELGEAAASPKVVISAHLTEARSYSALGDTTRAATAYELAVNQVRSDGPPSRRREILAEWAEYLRRAGREPEALDVYREAVRP